MAAYKQEIDSTLSKLNKEIESVDELKKKLMEHKQNMD